MFTVIPLFESNVKLEELYKHLFGDIPNNLHDSLIDTYICLRCFVKMRFKFELSLRNFPQHITFRNEY